MPWIHLQDLVSLLIWSADTGVINAPVNGVAPNPVTNAQLTAAMGRILKKPAFLPIPPFALYALLGDFAYALLYSQRVMPETAQAHGFVWKFPDIESALQDILAD